MAPGSASKNGCRVTELRWLVKGDKELREALCDVHFGGDGQLKEAVEAMFAEGSRTRRVMEYVCNVHSRLDARRVRNYEKGDDHAGELREGMRPDGDDSPLCALMRCP